jgi:NAD(P)-dependent dehydrogenase (short-subunit alcohol dehydrogenase family)
VFLAAVPSQSSTRWQEISATGRVAKTAEVDALDETAVDEHADAVATGAGGIHVSFNAISIRDVQLIPLVEMSREDFMSPILTGATTHFLTARAAHDLTGLGGDPDAFVFYRPRLLLPL